jgi:hypothetical protein
LHERSQRGAAPLPLPIGPLALLGGLAALVIVLGVALIVV